MSRRRTSRRTSTPPSAPTAPAQAPTPTPPPPPPPPPPPLQHGLPPVLDAHTRLLVLGSFPGAASLAAQAYYAHPRNQFWPLCAAVLGIELVGLVYAERLAALQAAGVGLWDVYAACRRVGSLDSAIRDAQPNPLHTLKSRAPQLQVIAHNGLASARWHRATEALGVTVCVLPSSSPAYAALGFADKRARWAEVFARAGLPASAA